MLVYLSIDGIDYSDIIAEPITREFETVGQIYTMLDGSKFDNRKAVSVAYRFTAFYDNDEALYYSLVEKLIDLKEHTITTLYNGIQRTFTGFLQPVGDTLKHGARYDDLTFSAVEKLAETAV